MRYRIGLALGVIASLIFLNLVLGQEAQNEPEALWLWGEVVSVDTQNKTFLVKYLDFETDQEKEISINLDEKTTYENIKSLDELIPKDNVSIDYIQSPDAKNLAKNIVVEKSEEATESVPTEEILPQKSESLPAPGQQ